MTNPLPDLKVGDSHEPLVLICAETAHRLRKLISNDKDFELFRWTVPMKIEEQWRAIQSLTAENAALKARVEGLEGK